MQRSNNQLNMLLCLQTALKYISPLALSLSTAGEPIIGGVIGAFLSAMLLSNVCIVVVPLRRMHVLSDIAGYLLGLTPAPR